MRTAVVLALLAAAPGPSATEAIKARDAEVRAVLPPMGTEPSEAQKQKAQELITKFIDFPTMAQAALGKHWAGMSEAKRKELVAAFTRRLKEASVSQIDFYRSTAIKYEPETPADGDRVKVPTSMDVKGEPTEVAYVLKPSKGGWLIEDIVIDEVSTVENYKGSFAKVIEEHGVDDLIARLNKTKAEQGDGGSALPPVKK